MTTSRIRSLGGWILAAALVWLCWQSAGGAQLLLLLLAGLVGLWLAVTVAVCAAAQHRRATANTHLSQRRRGSSSGAVATPHLRR